MNQKKRDMILFRFNEINPNPCIELIFNSNFELLISVLLSSQTRDTCVNKVTKKLFAIANTPKEILDIGLYKIKEYINKVGMYHIKSKNIIKLSRILIDKFGGLVPNNRKDLESLPGIGRKSANLILNVAFKQPTIAVDRHVFRVCNRTNFVVGKNVLEIEKKMLKSVPKKFIIKCHNWFVLHGRYICLARKPKCNICFIRDLCEFKYKQFFI